MARMRNVLLRMATAMFCCLMMAVPAFAYEKWWWIDGNGNWFYSMPDGTLATSTWVHDSDDGEWYLLSEDGEMRTGIYESEGKYYLLDTVRGTGTYGKLLKSGSIYQGVHIHTDTTSEYEGALTEDTITDLLNAGVDFSNILSVTGTQHVENGEVKRAGNTTGSKQSGKKKLPDDVMTWNGHSYKYYNSNRTWQQAKTYCESLGGHLASITSQEEQDAIYEYIQDVAGDVDIWIGITDSKEEGNWETWVTGEKLVYTNWGDGEPDNDGGQGQDYGVIVNGLREGKSGSGATYHIEAGEWDDIAPGNSTDSGDFLCEWDYIE